MINRLQEILASLNGTWAGQAAAGTLQQAAASSGAYGAWQQQQQFPQLQLAQAPTAPAFGDTVSPAEKSRIQQDRDDRASATPFRNVGPSDLTSFPDRNAYTPDDMMINRNFPQGDNI